MEALNRQASMNTRRIFIAVSACVIVLASVTGCSIRLGGVEEGSCYSEQPGLYLSFAGDTPEEKLLNLSEFDVNTLNERLGVDWLNSRTDQKSEAYFRLSEYPSERQQTVVRETLLATGMVDEVRFGPIGATMLGDC
jgi:hypothetical protein